MKNRSATFITAILACLCTTTYANADNKKPIVRESVEIAQHQIFNSDTTVNGATILIRDLRNRVVDVTVTSKALIPDTAYSIWIAAFNKPQHCETPYRCTVRDLGNARVRASVFWGGGLISDAYGYGGTQLKLLPGKTKRELFAGGDFGLANMRAEIHVVLRSHGAIGLAGDLASQLGTAKMACPPENCSNDFASIHILDR